MTMIMIMIMIHTDYVDPKPDILHGYSHYVISGYSNYNVRAARPVKSNHNVPRFRFGLTCGGNHVEKPAIQQDDHQWVFGKVIQNI